MTITPRNGPGLALVIGVATALATPAVASSDTVKVRLQRAGSDTDAGGTARVKVRDRRGALSGTLDLRGRRLARRATYQVTIDGVVLGTLATTRRGRGRARFRTTPSDRRDQLLGVDPRGRAIAIVDDAGTVVLAATVGNGTLDPSDVRCCLPDGDAGTACADRTAAECAAGGGIDLGPGSCLANPCDAGAPAAPGDRIACCFPADAGPECEDRTTAACAAQNGINLGTRSCIPNPCVPGGSPTSTTLPGGGTAMVTVTCERRTDRSRAAVNANGLASGSYRARLTSGANVTLSAVAAASGDELEFDFDSEPDDILAGAAAIPAPFLQGSPPQATGEILDATNHVVVSATVTCAER